jgi:serine/threonine protein kinase
LGVRLFYFKNENDKTFTKVFAYSKDPELEPNNVLIKILSEVYYHKKFSELQSSCNFRVPKLLKYGFIEHNNDENINIGDEFIFYIKMEDVDATPVTKLNEIYDNKEVLGKCIDIEEEVNRINTCLQEHNLHHNDLHTDNVMVDKNGELIIIDFGESSNLLQKPLLEDFCSIFKKQGGRRTIRKNRRMITKKMRGMSKNRRRYISKKMRSMYTNRRRRISKKRKI